MLAKSVDSSAAASDSCVEVQIGATLAIAASSFSLADLCFTASKVSHDSSSRAGSAFRVKSAIFLWHLITARMAVPKALLSASPHFRVAATPPDGSSLLCGTQPVSSLAHDTPDPPSLQSKCWPWPGGAATAAPAATRKHPPMTDPRSRFMRPPPLAYL